MTRMYFNRAKKAIQKVCKILSLSELRRRKEATHFIDDLAQKLDRVPTFGDIIVETDHVPDRVSYSPPLAKPDISDEERKKLSAELENSIRNWASFDRIKSLLDKGAEPDANVMGLAMYKYDGRAFQIYDLLLAHGADLNAKDRYGYTPLMMAARACHLSACIWLVKRSNGKLDIDATNSLNQSALDIAKEYKPYTGNYNDSVYGYLLLLGARGTSHGKEEGST
jgi:hypothetical protein